MPRRNRLPDEPMAVTDALNGAERCRKEAKREHEEMERFLTLGYKKFGQALLDRFPNFKFRIDTDGNVHVVEEEDASGLTNPLVN
jgi:hypothetical protein